MNSDLDCHYTSPNYASSLYQQGRVLNRIIEEMDFTDVWWTLHPSECRFTCHTRARNMAKVFARLDYTFVSPDMLTHVLDSSIGVAYHSDHSPLFLQFSLQENDSGKGIWRVPTYILGDPAYRELINQTIREIEGHNPDANPALLWETIKACIHGDTIRFLARQNIAKKCQNRGVRNGIFSCSSG